MSDPTLASPGEDGGGGFELPPRPYPGLRPFTKEEWPVFFGRERMADEVIAGLIRQRLVFVHGDSGCGKSSLIRAGVFARLEQGWAGAPWRTETALPRQSPLWNVAAALARLAGEDADEGRIIEWRRALNCGSEAPAAIAELRAQANCDPGCLLIDQFEEVFQHARSSGPEEAQLLTRALIALHRAPPAGLYLAMTMRSEYLGACARYEGFAELVNVTQYLLPRMGHEDILRAIREPALLFDGEVSRELAERLIADAGGGQDQLPLIQHGLMRLYLARRSAGDGPWRLAIIDFPKEGGLAGRLSNHADELADRVCSEVDTVRGRQLVEDIFRALTEINSDGQAIRRPQTFAQLTAVVATEAVVLRPVIEVFRADGVSFLSPYGGGPLASGDLIDVGHEALIRCWRALADPADGWLVREFRSGLVWRALLVQAESFERDPKNVLAPTTTDEREQWMRRRNPHWAQRYGGGWERVERLIAASAAARDEARRAQAEALRKEGRATVLRKSITALGALVGLLVAALFYASAQIQESRMQFASVEVTRMNNSELKASLAASQARSQELETELKESVQALHQVRNSLAHAASTPSSRTMVVATIDKAAQDLTSQAGRLSSAVTQLATPVRPSVPPSGPRVYFHIAEAGQRPAAQGLEAFLEGQTLGRSPIIVPGIELVKVYPSRAALRCFDAGECRNQAPALLAQINSRLALPQVQLEDLSERYGGTQGIRSGHYELWFPPGKIVLRGS